MIMTKRLYYDQPELLEFHSVIEDVAGDSSRPALILRETAFYPTSGGQVHDTGWLTVGNERLRVLEVAEAEDGRVVHYLEVPPKATVGGTAIHGRIDAERRHDHMQQHTGQHVLSAAFVELYQLPTVSFHMGDNNCTIDLVTESLTAAQVMEAEKRANEIVFQNRPVKIRYVKREEAEKLGLRKLPPEGRDELRLIEVADFDLSACGGTHVSATGQIGSILLRKTEKTRQGMRVEFVCGARAVRAARRDYALLSEAAGLYSAQTGDVPEMIRKGFDEAKALRRQRDDVLEQLATAMAEAALVGAQGSETAARDRGMPPSESQPSVTAATSRRIIVRTFADRDINFAKLFAQKVARAGVPAVALVASSMDPPGLVFAQFAGGPFNVGALLKETLASVGGRGGGSRDFAQGGVPAGSDLEQILRQAARTIESQAEAL